MNLRAENITKQFIRKRKGSNVMTAVQDVSLTLPEQGLTLIYGHSGSGKSTLMNMLAGLLAPTSGQVFLDDTDLYKLDDQNLSKLRRDHFGMIPQGQTALHSLTVMENVLLPYALFGKKGREEAETAGAEAYARELLEMTGISDLRDVKPGEMSGGEIRRMAIARALIRKPEFLLADEPTADLDEDNTKIVLDLFQAQADHGKSVLIISHDPTSRAFADTTYLMRDGLLLPE